jgi:hypothetical protein
MWSHGRTMKVHILSKTPLTNAETQLIRAAINHFRLTAIQMDSLYLISGALDAIKGSNAVPEPTDVRRARIKKNVEAFASNSFDGMTVTVEWEPDDFRDPIAHMN